jgi:tetratricopeptide (TPR) repeat protein
MLACVVVSSVPAEALPMPSSNPSTDRNLLLGILALQMDFVSRDALLAGMHAWVLRKSTPLGQLLLEQGPLRADTHALLEALVEKHLQMHGNASQSLAAINSIGVLREDIHRIADPDLCASVAQVSIFRKDGDFPVTPPLPGGPSEDADVLATRLPSTDNGFSPAGDAANRAGRADSVSGIDSLALGREVDAVCDRFEQALRRGETVDLDHLLPACQPLRGAALPELARLELQHRLRAGRPGRAEDYLLRYPELAANPSGVALLRAAEQGLGPEAPAPTYIEVTASQGNPDDRPPSIDGYAVSGEKLGTGGMGVVWRGCDSDLNREVAVKVMRCELSNQPRLHRRFVEEAQVTSQLQHPGIPPIHELGTLADGRPYFVMKVVKGRTLADLLAERPSPAEELPRFLGIFDHVCQAVAYAHSKGVIHRDLKPANVMVGAFGEVQVMDWGLAKLLSDEPGPGRQGPEDGPAGSVVETLAAGTDGPTEVGTVLGTYTYMPPEQARGEVGRLDRRSDVFGLGAILCQILTGKPPYDGTREELPALVQLGQLGPAWQRLQACGADATLARLARSCLAARQEERPADAAAVARAVAAHQAAVQQRLRQAEVERAAAEARADEEARTRQVAQAKAAVERRARRLTLGLAVAGMVVLVLGTAGIVYWVQQRRWANRQVEQGLDQVARLRQAYRFADAEDMLARVREWARQAGSEWQDSLARAEDDLHLARKLDRVRQEAATLAEGDWDPGRVREQYPKVLAEHALNVLEGDLDKLAEMIRARAVRESIVAALDEWSREESNRQRQHRLLELANRADDPEPWRQGVRGAFARRDVRRLRQLLRGMGPGKSTPGVVLLLASAFSRESQEPLALLRRMQLEWPHDFWVNFILGSRLVERKKYQEAVECFLVAVALRPDSALAQYNLGMSLKNKGEVDEAIACYRKAVALDPKFAAAHYNLGNALGARGKQDEAFACYQKASACYRQAIALAPTDAKAHYHFGVTLKALGKEDQAIASYRQAIHLDPTLALAHTNLGGALAARGEVEEALACCKKALDLDPTNAQTHYNLGAAWSARGKEDEAIDCYQKALAIDPALTLAHTNLGGALLARRRVEEAITCFRNALALAPTDAKARFNLGFALQSRGEVDEAIDCYRKAVALDPKLAAAHYNLGNVLGARGKVEEAIACYQKASELDPNDAKTHGALGQELMRQGHLKEAEKSLRRCLALRPANPTDGAFAAHLLQQCQKLLDADDRLHAYRAGKGGPTDAATQLLMASVAGRPARRLYLTAARLYRDAFARQPQLAAAHRYNAACYAALAAAGQGEDTAKLDDKEKARLRKQALDWLRADLVLRTRQLETGKPADRAAVQQTLRHWQKDTDLAGLRAREALAKLPAEEYEAFTHLWADVAALLKKAEKPK